MTKTWLVHAGWVVVGFVIGIVLWLFSMFVLFPIIPYPAAAIGTAPFFGLILWAAWLVTARVRGKQGSRLTAVLAGALVPLLVMAGNSIINTPQAIAFFGAR